MSEMIENCDACGGDVLFEIKARTKLNTQVNNPKNSRCGKKLHAIFWHQRT